MNTEITESERAALEVLRSTGIDVLKAALVAKEALECERRRVKRARECVRLGAEEMRKRERTVTFAKSVEIALEDWKRKGLRARSIVDFRYLCKRMMKMNPGLAERRMWSVTAGDCRRYLETAFGGSAAQYRKACSIMISADQQPEAATHFMKRNRGDFPCIMGNPTTETQKLPGYRDTHAVPQAILVDAAGNVITVGPAQGIISNWAKLIKKK